MRAHSTLLKLHASPQPVWLQQGTALLPRSLPCSWFPDHKEQCHNITSHEGCACSDMQWTNIICRSGFIVAQDNLDFILSIKTMDMSGLAVNLIVTAGMLTSVVGSPSVTVVGKTITSYFSTCSSKFNFTIIWSLIFFKNQTHREKHLSNRIKCWDVYFQHFHTVQTIFWKIVWHLVMLMACGWYSEEVSSCAKYGKIIIKQFNCICHEDTLLASILVHFFMS